MVDRCVIIVEAKIREDENMKRLISVMLVLAVCLLGCALGEPMDVTGEWFLNIIESEGVQLDPAQLGFELTLTLNADGSATMRSFDEADSSCTWIMDGENVVITDPAGDILTAAPEGANLVVHEEENGFVMILGREKAAPSGYVPAAVEENPAMEDFQGTWNAAIIDMMGMQLPMEAIGMKLVVEIKDATATVTSNESGTELTYTAPAHLEGDTLTVEAADDQMPLPLNLQQDGKLVWVEDNEGMTIRMYFEKIA